MPHRVWIRLCKWEALGQAAYDAEYRRIASELGLEAA